MIRKGKIVLITPVLPHIKHCIDGFLQRRPQNLYARFSEFPVVDDDLFALSKFKAVAVDPVITELPGYLSANVGPSPYFPDVKPAKFNNIDLLKF